MEKRLVSLVCSFVLFCYGCKDSEENINLSKTQMQEMTAYVILIKTKDLVDRVIETHIKSDSKKRDYDIYSYYISKQGDSYFPYIQKHFKKKCSKFLDKNTLLIEDKKFKFNIKKKDCYEILKNSKIKGCLENIMYNYTKHQIKADTVFVYLSYELVYMEDDGSMIRYYVDKAKGIILKIEHVHFEYSFDDSKKEIITEKIGSTYEIVQELNFVDKQP